MVHFTLRCISPCHRYLGAACEMFQHLLLHAYSRDEALMILELKGGFEYCCRRTVMCHVSPIQPGVEFIQHRTQLEKHLKGGDGVPMPAYYGPYRDASTVAPRAADVEGVVEEATRHTSACYDRGESVAFL